MDNNLSGFDQEKDIMIGNNCSFKGEINSAGTVFVGESASVLGDINAESILVAGKITDGDITVVGEIRLLSKAIVYCNLKARKISSEAGAVFKGFFELL